MDHESINPPMTRPSVFCANAAFITVIVSCLSFFLARDAAPRVEWFRNPLAFLCLSIFLISVFMAFIPRMLNWGWKAKYFGVSLIHLGSFAMFGMIPWACILFYSSLPIGIRLIGVFVYGAILIFWCKRFEKIYAKIFSSKKTADEIYREVGDVFYYTQQADKKILKKLKFSQAPPVFLCIGLLVLAFAMLPFAHNLEVIVGLPFIHIFLAVAAIPTDMMACGLLTRGLIIYYKHPNEILKNTNKQVYVDLVSV